MNLTIPNAIPVMAADHATLGAALKIMVAGGGSLDRLAQKRASGLTDYNWTRKGDDVIALVGALETAAPAEV